MSRKVKEDEIDVDEATEEAKEAESEQVDVEKKAEKLSAKAVRDIIFPEIGGKELKNSFSEMYENFVGHSDEDIVLAYREFYKNSMAKKAASKKAVYEDPALKVPAAVVEETAAATVAEAKVEAVAAPAPVIDEAALKKQYMKSVYENIDSVVCATESEKAEFIKSLNVENLSVDEAGELITSVVGKLAEYHTTKAEAKKEEKPAEPRHFESFNMTMAMETEAPAKASRGYHDVWESNSLVRHYDDGRPDDIINRIKAAKPVHAAAKPQQYVAPAAKVAATPTKPIESKPQNSFVSEGQKFIVNDDGTLSVQAERKPVKPTFQVLMNLKGGTQLVLASTYLNHGGRLASGSDYEIPGKGSVKVEAVVGGFNETVTWNDGGTKESFYPAVKAVGLKLSDKAIRMTKVPDGISDEDITKICKAIGSVIGQKLSDQTLGDIAKHLGEEAAWSFVKPIIFNKTK